MPYIITTTTALNPGLPVGDPKRGSRKSSRLAVATLDEVAPYAERYIFGPPVDVGVEESKALDAINNLGESGGTVGPLPDGTVIEVEQAVRSSMLSPEGFSAYVLKTGEVVYVATADDHAAQEA